MDIAIEGRARWENFRKAMLRLAEDPGDESGRLDSGAEALAKLIAFDDWLPDSFAASDPVRYQQHLLHRDPANRLSVVSFVWGPGQATPIHDHTVWGLVGVLRGRETSQRYARGRNGKLRACAGLQIFEPGDIDRLSPSEGDIHKVTNIHDGISISIHIYGADIGTVERSAFGTDGETHSFISGYSHSRAPQDWTGNRL